MNAPPISLCDRLGAGIERLFTPQHGPGDAGELIRQCDDGRVLVHPCQKRAQPSSERGLTLRKRWENSPGAVDQQFAKTAIASLGNPDQTGFAACRDLPGREAEPSGKVLSARERFAFADSRGESRRVQRADAGDSRRRAASSVFARAANSSSVGYGNIVSLFPSAETVSLTPLLQSWC